MAQKILGECGANPSSDPLPVSSTNQELDDIQLNSETSSYRENFSNGKESNMAPTIDHNSYSLPVTLIEDEPVTSIKQDPDTHPNSETEPFPVSVIKEEFECSVCNLKFPCLKELESHWTVHFGHYIHYSDSVPKVSWGSEPDQ